VPDLADQTTPGTDRALARSKPSSVYTQAGAAELVSMAGESLPAAGGDQPHNNMPPALVLKYVIATQGVFPERPS
jgi:microcystin-dependent protein